MMLWANSGYCSQELTVEIKIAMVIGKPCPALQKFIYNYFNRLTNRLKPPAKEVLERDDELGENRMT